MIIEIIFAVLMLSAIITLGYTVKQISNLSSNAFSFIKANGIEEKIQSDSLDRTLKKIEKIAPPTVKKPSENPRELDFVEGLIRNGHKKDARGHEWEIM